MLRLDALGPAIPSLVAASAAVAVSARDSLEHRVQLKLQLLLTSLFIEVDAIEKAEPGWSRFA